MYIASAHITVNILLWNQAAYQFDKDLFQTSPKVWFGFPL